MAGRRVHWSLIICHRVKLRPSIFPVKKRFAGRELYQYGMTCAMIVYCLQS